MNKIRILESLLVESPPSVPSAAEADARLAHALSQPFQPFPTAPTSEPSSPTGQTPLSQPVHPPSQHVLPSSRMLTRQRTLDISQEPQPQQVATPSRRLRRQSGVTQLRATQPSSQGSRAPPPVNSESSIATTAVPSERALTRQQTVIEPAQSASQHAVLPTPTNEHQSLVPTQPPASTVSSLPLVRRVYSAGVAPPYPIVQFDPRGGCSANQSAPLFVSGQMPWAVKRKVSLRESGRKIRSSTTRALNALPKKHRLLESIVRKRKQLWDVLESTKSDASSRQRLALPPPASDPIPSTSIAAGSPARREWVSLPPRAAYTPSPTVLAYIAAHARTADNKPLSPEEIDSTIVLQAHRAELEQMPRTATYAGPHTADSMRTCMERRKAKKAAAKARKAAQEMTVEVARLEGREKQLAILRAREHEIARLSYV
ncbi:hypothetical protein C8Q80DRAFT_1269986 [Daedaleopsis nitida]|nr:hypothetical protein C8Q80DRAFT_1269986 [Daedaleopsis nitida]